MTPILHEYSASGNCYKIRLTAAHVGVALERREYDILRGETRTPEFLAKVNANGRIPVLQLGDRFLPESNAAAWYLAEGSALIPEERFARADLLHWLFWEQYNHEPNVATLRFWRRYVGEDKLTPLQRAQIEGKEAGGAAALALMDQRLGSAPFLLGAAFSLADIVLYAYTHVAGEGGFDLNAYPAVRGWLDRVAAQPGHVAMA
ncbi:MAG: glutathione S-transferase family protein [Sphingomonas sp.]|uniref:glutathione S-transferase family protein n=1 Tax=Sphingomonas sp. TaxID=28214 RepID=UPI0025E0B03D|nr:glutathione S-transferase family protein [Sphingomonas sp.]MBX9882839.1 glutathione S-transferase family protein [Sphingomonas sp.]